MFIDQVTFFCCNFTLDIFSNGLFQKKSKHRPRVEDMDFHTKGIEERAHENPRAQLKRSEISGVLIKN